MHIAARGNAGKKIMQEVGLTVRRKLHQLVFFKSAEIVPSIDDFPDGEEEIPSDRTEQEPSFKSTGM